MVALFLLNMGSSLPKSSDPSLEVVCWFSLFGMTLSIGLVSMGLDVNPM
jgi:hypothetical protein